MLKTLDDLEPAQRVLIRADLNSPVDDGVVLDNKRFFRHAVTLSELVDADHRVAVMTHQGRPDRETFITLDQHAEILSTHLNREVSYVPDTCGEVAISAIRDLEPGDVLVLENVRMVADELADRTPSEHAKSEFVRRLSTEFDVYVNDAYSSAHRAHASLVGFPSVMDAYAGRVMETEYVANSSIQSREFDGPVVMALGGTKADDLVYVMDRVEGRVDTILLGGVVGELFLRAAGYDVGYDVEGSTLFDDQWENNRGAIERLLDEYGERIRLPTDLAYEDADGRRAEVGAESAAKTTPFFDIGRETVESFRPYLEGADAVFVKGALGVFEDERFSHGTVGVLDVIAGTDAFSVVGGGDTSRALELYDIDEDGFSHVSIAGGAYVRALTGESLPAIDALER